MSFNCEVYTIDTLVWPQQTFPRSLFPHWSGQHLTAARNAWTYYELVETADAALRVSTAGSGNENITWTPFDTQGARQRYNYGKWLHQQACTKIGTCNINWISQRDLGYSAIPLTTIWGPPCSTCGSGYPTGLCPDSSSQL